MKVRRHKIVLFTLAIVLLVFPLFQNVTEVIAIPPLKGAFKTFPQSIFNSSNWFSGNYQSVTEKYVQQNLSIRSVLIRFNNQLNFTCFGKTCSPNLFVGKTNYLFNNDILSSYYGDDVLVKDTICNELDKLAFVQDTLEKLNKHIVFIIAPSKPSLCEEFVPVERAREKKTNNYDLYSACLKQSKVNYIDYVSYFRTLKQNGKNKSPYLLFPPKGLHWSVYGASFATDSLVHYVEKRANTKLTSYEWGDIAIGEPTFYDVDVEDALNLQFLIPTEDLAYPKLNIGKRGNDSLKIIAVSDSFYGMLFYNGLKELFPPSSEYWFYGRKIYANGIDYKEDVYFSQIDLVKKINEADVILIFQNDANLSRLGFGFIDRLYRLFKNDKRVIPFDMEYNKYVSRKVADIKSDKDWMNKIALKANNNSSTIDSLVKAQAIQAVEMDIWNRVIRLP